MRVSNAQEKFIHEWGKLCTQWGVNKTMGRIHALLLVSKDDMCANEIMCKLCLSGGNVNMNLKALEQWNLISKVSKEGERKDFYRAEKDLGEVFKIIVTERKKRELDPLLALLEEVKCVKADCPESSEFCKMTKELHRFAKRADHALNTITGSKTDWISKILLR